MRATADRLSHVRDIRRAGRRRRGVPGVDCGAAAFARPASIDRSAFAGRRIALSMIVEMSDPPAQDDIQISCVTYFRNPPYDQPPRGNLRVLTSLTRTFGNSYRPKLPQRKPGRGPQARARSGKWQICVACIFRVSRRERRSPYSKAAMATHVTRGRLSQRAKRHRGTADRSHSVNSVPAWILRGIRRNGVVRFSAGRTSG